MKEFLMVALWARSAPIMEVLFLNVTTEEKKCLIGIQNIVERIEMLSYALIELKPLADIVGL